MLQRLRRSAHPLSGVYNKMRACQALQLGMGVEADEAGRDYSEFGGSLQTARIRSSLRMKPSGDSSGS